MKPKYPDNAASAAAAPTVLQLKARHENRDAMMTYAQIAKLDGQTSLPLIEAMQALAENSNNSDDARSTMTNGDFGHVDIIDRKTAESLATVLVDERLRFTCETTAQERWRFRILPESVARVCILADLPQRRADD